MNCHVLMSVLHRECAPTKTRIIGVLVPDLEDALCTSLLARIEVLAGEGGYKVHIVGALGFPSRARRQTKNLQRDITVEGSPKTRPNISVLAYAKKFCCPFIVRYPPSSRKKVANFLSEFSRPLA